VWLYTRGRVYSPGVKKGRDNPYRSGVGVTTVKRDRHAITQLDGATDFNIIEDEFQKVESVAARSLSKLDDRAPLDDLDKAGLADLIGSLWRRPERRMSNVRPMLDRHMRDGQAVARQLALGGHFWLAAPLQRALDFLDTPAGRHHMLMRTATEPLKLMHAGMMKMCWLIGVAPAGTSFVTCDTPVIFDETSGIRDSPLLSRCAETRSCLVVQASLMCRTSNARPTKCTS
jgi:hypothetical protein